MCALASRPLSRKAPLIVRPHPEVGGSFQVLDGHQRLEVLRRLGRSEATCYIWPCDDETALRLLATLNRLEGQDDPSLRAELLRELATLASPEELARLLPEDAGSIRRSLELLDLNLDRLLADLQQEAEAGPGLRAVTFAMSPDDEAAVEEAILAASKELSGANRRGRALGAIARAYTGRRQE